MLPGALPDPLTTVGDLTSLFLALAAVAGVVWGAVIRATKPLRRALDEVRALGSNLEKERRRVDDLTDQVEAIERRLGSIEKRVEDLYALLVQTIQPTVKKAATRRRPAVKKKGTDNE